MPGTGIGISTVFGNKVADWTPLSLGAKILYWGKTSEISGGQMPNKVSGSSDFLTVIGSPYTFQTPNNATYIAADTDYIWFKTDTTQRTTTTAELIGYDLQRTPVKYGDVAPNTLTEIVILKGGEVLTADEVNSLHAYMHLSTFWSGIQNDYGYLKDNRIGQQLWTPETVEQAETTALIARMGSQTAGQRTAIDAAIAALKTANLWTRWNVVRFLHTANAGDQLLNWKGNTFPAVTTGASNTFTAFSGQVSGNATSGLKESFIPSSDGGGLFTKNDASDIYYIDTCPGTRVLKICGVTDGTNLTTLGDVDAIHGAFRLNQGAAGQVDVQWVNGLNGIIRTGAAVQYVIREATKTDSITASSNLPTKEMYSLCYNNNGVAAGGGSTYRLRARFIGGSVTQAEFNTLRTICTNFFAAYTA